MSGTFSPAGQGFTSVTAPLRNSGLPTRPNLSIAAATTSAAGSMSAADKALVNQLTTDSGWLAASYQPNWSDFGAGAPTGAYKKDALGWVCLKGTVKKGAALALPDFIFVLPVGYRPATEHAFSVGSAGGYTRAVVATDGTVYILNGGSATATNLDGIRFDPAT